MGLGGYLAWTAAAREIRKRTGHNTKMIPVESHGNFIKVIDSEIFRHNEDFCLDFKKAAAEGTLLLPMVLNNQNANYCKKDTPQKAFHRQDKHIIEQYCEVYGIENPELKCYLTTSEDCWSDTRVRSEVGEEKFVVIEPNSKTNYTPNRAYPFEKWQKIVDDLKEEVNFVQVGVSGSKILNNVIDLTGKTSFRDTAKVIQMSELFISAEGGLVHVATAVNTKSIVLITGYQSEKMVAYPQNINVNISNHEVCGLKVSCDLCKADAENHDHSEISKLIRKEICP